MIIGVPKEVKEHEYRVSITPSGVKELVEDGNTIIVEHMAGAGSGFADEEYRKKGAELFDKRRLFSKSELIVKVKEPLPSEFDYLRDGQALFTFLHLAPNPELTRILLKRHIAGFAYETLEVNGTLPLLEPMSEIAGKMAPLMGACYLQKIHGGSGVLVTGTGDVSPARILILGAGTVSMGALQVAHGMGAHVTVINRGEERLIRIKNIYGSSVRTVRLSEEAIREEVKETDILIGAVLIPGARTPKLVSKSMVSQMKKGSVIVDVSVDQGGCVETTRPTTHSDPVYTVDNVVHYTVANMPGAYPRTSTLALTNRTLEYIKIMAKHGIENALVTNIALQSALNTYRGEIKHKALTGKEESKT